MKRILVASLICTACLPLAGCNSNPLPTTPQSTGSNPSTSSISISPTSAQEGSADLQLTVTGHGFANETHRRSQVLWVVDGNTTGLATTFVSDTQLTAIVPATLLTTRGSARLLVSTGDPMGDESYRTNEYTLAITQFRPPAPSIVAISPDGAPAGSADLTITVTGSNFVNTATPHSHHSVATWIVAGKYDFLETTFVSGTQLKAVIPATFMTDPVSAFVRVDTWYYMDDVPEGISNRVTFTVK